MAEVFRKTANAKLKVSGRGLAAHLDSDAQLAHASVLGVAEVMNLVAGGNWVGGTVFMNDQVLAFRPNKLNVRLHEGDLDVTMQVGSIQGAEIAGGFGTKIIAVSLDDGSVFRFRCTKARDVLALLLSAVERSPG